MNHLSFYFLKLTGWHSQSTREISNMAEPSGAIITSREFINILSLLVLNRKSFSLLQKKKFLCLIVLIFSEIKIAGGPIHLLLCQGCLVPVQTVEDGLLNFCPFTCFFLLFKTSFWCKIKISAGSLSFKALFGGPQTAINRLSFCGL